MKVANEMQDGIGILNKEAKGKKGTHLFQLGKGKKMYAMQIEHNQCKQSSCLKYPKP